MTFKQTILIGFAMLILPSLAWTDGGTSKAQNSLISTSWTGSEPSTIANETQGSDGNTVYLYNVGKKLWLGRGGRWGTEAVLSEVAQEFTLSGSDAKGYKFKTSMRLQGGSSTANSYFTMTNGTNDVSTYDYATYFLDQSHTTLSTVKFEDVPSNDSHVYRMYITNTTKSQEHMSKGDDYYVVASRNTASSDPDGRNDYINGFLKNSWPDDKSDQWILVTKKEYKEKFQNADASTAQPVPGTFLMRDNDFARNDMEITKWECAFDGNNDYKLYNGVTTKSLNASNMDSYEHSPADATTGNGYVYYVGNGYANMSTQTGKVSEQATYGDKWTANIHGAEGKVHQTLDGIFREGWYQVRCHAFTTGALGTAKIYASVDGATKKKTKYTEYAEDNVLTLQTAPSTYSDANDVVNSSREVDGRTTYPYTASVLVYVDKKNDTMQPIDFGIKVKDAEDNAWTCFDDFQIYYLGTTPNEIVLDEERTDILYMNTQNNDKARSGKSTVYLHRSLNAGKWNSLLLPFTMNENQIQSIFGSGTIVSAFRGATDESHPNRMYFEETKAIEAGKLYIIKPSKGEDSGLPRVSASADPDNIYLADGKYYTIPQVSYGQATDFKAEVTGETGSETYNEGTVQFEGTYISHGSEPYIPENSYVLNGNNKGGTAGLWYYRTVKTKTKGFRGWLHVLNSSKANSVDFSINGVVDEATSIEGITTDAPVAKKNAKGVFNLNGQLLRADSCSLEGLPHGIYIVNGRKYVVE